ncbi:hypothetical protein LTR86_003170 [Recurvomyces mirabilis]|nr:hypothetical protein LTR86_003170 [Recurvomyces mirabilis]
MFVTEIGRQEGIIEGNQVDTSQTYLRNLRIHDQHDSEEDANTGIQDAQLLALPAEIRVEIWTLCFLSTGTHTIKNESIPGLIQTCQQLRSKCQLMFFALTKFRINITSHAMSAEFLDFYKWLLNIGPSACAAIKHIDVVLHVTEHPNHRYNQSLGHSPNG